MAGHADIRKNDLGLELREARQTLGAAVGDANVHAQGLHEQREAIGDVRRVVDDQDAP
jgi:hypothetical protein